VFDHIVTGLARSLRHLLCCHMMKFWSLVIQRLVVVEICIVSEYGVGILTVCQFAEIQFVNNHSLPIVCGCLKKSENVILTV
jgi:hypothetical protein